MDRWEMSHDSLSIEPSHDTSRLQLSDYPVSHTAPEQDSSL
jgi:hypothetical protein